jgi:hypothetical protein
MKLRSTLKTKDTNIVDTHQNITKTQTLKNTQKAKKHIKTLETTFGQIIKIAISIAKLHNIWRNNITHPTQYSVHIDPCDAAYAMCYQFYRYLFSKHVDNKDNI